MSRRATNVPVSTEFDTPTREPDGVDLNLRSQLRDVAARESAAHIWTVDEADAILRALVARDDREGVRRLAKVTREVVREGRWTPDADRMAS